jgi:hypothetical protein
MEFDAQTLEILSHHLQEIESDLDPVLFFPGKFLPDPGPFPGVDINECPAHYVEQRLAPPESSLPLFST